MIIYMYNSVISFSFHQNNTDMVFHVHGKLYKYMVLSLCYG